jgi:hypothetical protein
MVLRGILEQLVQDEQVFWNPLHRLNAIARPIVQVIANRGFCDEPSERLVFHGVLVHVHRLIVIVDILCVDFEEWGELLECRAQQGSRRPLGDDFVQSYGEGLVNAEQHFYVGEE